MATVAKHGLRKRKAHQLVSFGDEAEDAFEEEVGEDEPWEDAQDHVAKSSQAEVHPPSPQLGGPRKSAL